MKKLFLFGLLSFFSASLFSQSVVGFWKTISDVDGKPGAKIEIYEKNGKYYGKVVDIYDPKDKDNLCTACKGEKHNKKIMGMIILKDLVKKGSKYEDGEILDPDNGKTYSCYMELLSKDKLKLRGFIGFSMIGRTQYWYRVA